MADTKQKKVLVAMSGGVDSSVTACLLREQGFEVEGIHMLLWKDPNMEPSYALADAEKTAKKIGIPLHVADLKDTFKKTIVDYFCDSYTKGITPNPCIECNREIKFGALLAELFKHKADFLATGHYARNIVSNGVHKLFKGKDDSKDQSYFLYTLTQEKLSRVLFPLGELKKTEVRKLADSFGLSSLNKKSESQNLCFFDGKTPADFLRRNLPKEAYKSGPIITVAGEKIGEHTGLPHYTIGQRKGLGIGGLKNFKDEEGEGWYVITLDTKTNTLIVGREADLCREEMMVENLSFVSQPAEFKGVAVKIRSRSQEQPAELELNENENTVTVKFKTPQRAVTPGQSAVFYKGDEVIGGGIIAPF